MPGSYHLKNEPTGGCNLSPRRWLLIVDSPALGQAPEQSMAAAHVPLTLLRAADQSHGSHEMVLPNGVTVPVQG